ncbi:MAG: amidophosphoribosyltransferase, partial [Defluviitaleaceae bacterium]|nr:amidophosphoribosyltransferase [Defluviitaleaceae bacterium]
MADNREASGIVAVAADKKNGGGLIYKLYTGLMSIQHRGQESAGIAVAKDGSIQCYRNKGLVSEVFDGQILSLLSGEMYLGHVKNDGEPEKYGASSQPAVINYKHGFLATAFSGALVNANALRAEMEDGGAVFTSLSDWELVATLAAKTDNGDIALAAQKIAGMLRGGYACVLMTADTMVGIRDPYGIRPLCVGTLEGSYAFSSESNAFDMMGGKFVRDVLPGEIVVLKNGGITSLRIENHAQISLFADSRQPIGQASCIFEYIYYANPDSTIDGKNVCQCRERAGYILAKESPADADIVVGVPDSGTPAALGFSNGSGIPFAIGLIKNRYIGRTFIQPTQTQREMSVRIKLNPIRPVLEGKRIVLVEDSIVRGTTMRYLISAIRDAGAAEVHLRICSPPVLDRCYFGVAQPDRNDMIANNMPTGEVCKSLGADSLSYISLEGVL